VPSLRQSIALTVPNSFGSFPASAELADHRAIETHLVDLAGGVDVSRRDSSSTHTAPDSAPGVMQIACALPTPLISLLNVPLLSNTWMR
jgi:hypothetical protein